MIERDFDYVLKEHFDTSDRRSMQVLLSLNEADQNQAMAALASKLYQKIIDKVDDIDFGTIPASKGDITKIGNYQDMVDCINTINDILVHYRQDTSQLEVLTKAIDNIKDSKKMWERAFAIESELPMTFYNTIVLSIVSGVSLLISSSIDFISEPGETGQKAFTISFDKVGYTKTKDKLLFQNLVKFNKSYLKGDIEKVMSSVIKSERNLKESYNGEEGIKESLSVAAILGGVKLVTGGIFIAGLLLLVIPVMHELVSILYCARQKVSDYFEIQSKIVQFNAESLKYDYTKSDAEVKKIYDKQMKISEFFKKISSKFSVKMNKAESDAKKLIEKDKSEKYKVDDLDNEDVPGLTSSIF